MFLMSKITENKRQQNELNKQKITERELLSLNQKINKLLTKLEEHEQEAANSIEEECVICITSKATISTFPCGHCVICRRCFVKTIQNAVSQKHLPLRCVICREKIIRLKQSFTNMSLLTESNRSKYSGRRNNRSYQLSQSTYQHQYTKDPCSKSSKKNISKISSSSSMSLKNFFNKKKLQNQQIAINQNNDERNIIENAKVNSDFENVGVNLDSNDSSSSNLIMCESTGENGKIGELNESKESIDLKNKYQPALNENLDDIEEAEIKKNKNKIEKKRSIGEINSSTERTIESNRLTTEIQLEIENNNLERIEKIKKLTNERSLNRKFKNKILNRTFAYFNDRVQDVKFRRKEQAETNYPIAIKKRTWFRKLKIKTNRYLNEIKILFHF